LKFFTRALEARRLIVAIGHSLLGRVGFLKTNATALVGALYERNEPLRTRFARFGPRSAAVAIAASAALPSAFRISTFGG
jgi:dipeptide/tripeptide permease